MWPWLGAQGCSCKSGKGNTEDGNTKVWHQGDEGGVRSTCLGSSRGVWLCVGGIVHGGQEEGRLCRGG